MMKPTLQGNWQLNVPRHARKFAWLLYLSVQVPNLGLGSRKGGVETQAPITP
jgi:hypothetical protein